MLHVTLTLSAVPMKARSTCAEFLADISMKSSPCLSAKACPSAVVTHRLQKPKRIGERGKHTQNGYQAAAVTDLENREAASCSNWAPFSPTSRSTNMGNKSDVNQSKGRRSSQYQRKHTARAPRNERRRRYTILILFGSPTTTG